MYQYGEKVITEPAEKFVTPSLSNESFDITKPASRRCAKLMQSHLSSNSCMAVWYAGFHQEVLKKPAWTTYLGIGMVSSSFFQEVAQDLYEGSRQTSPWFASSSAGETERRDPSSGRGGWSSEL